MKSIFCRTFWNQVVMQNVRQKIDFIAVHNSYAPEEHNLGESAGQYQATLAANIRIRDNMQLIENDIAGCAAPQSRGRGIALTEHAALWYLPNSGDVTTQFNAVRRSQS